MAEMSRTVYLTGFMGTGKSVVGRALARRLRRPFVDLDAVIERKTGLSVADVFARRGERSFRRLEHDALKRVARRGGTVVALGGGALIDPSNRKLVDETGVLVRLTCERRELVRRLRPSRAERPLLAGGGLETRVAALVKARAGAYHRARWSVSTTTRSAEAAAALIARRLS